MRKTKKLSPQQERELLLKIKNSKGKKRTLYIKTMVHKNLSLVKFMVTRFFSYSKQDYDELVLEGSRALPKAIEKIDVEKNANLGAVYVGCWAKHLLRSYIEKVKLIKSSTSAKGVVREMTFYDDHYQGEEKSNSFSLLDTISSGSYESNAESIRQQDISKIINNLINSLDSRDMIFFVRLYYKIAPLTCLDIYHLADKEERETLLKELKINPKKREHKEKLEEALQEISCEEKTNSQIVKKYLEFFIPLRGYKFGEIATVLNKSENFLRKLKQNSFTLLQGLIKELGIPNLF